MKRTHSQLVRTCIDYMTAKGYWGGKIKSVGMWDKRGFYRKDKRLLRGFPDLIYFRPIIGKGTIAIEVKVGRDKLRPDQELFAKYCQLWGGWQYIEARSIDDLINRGL